MRGFRDFRGKEIKIAGLADDMFFVFRSVGESVEVVMIIIGDLSTVLRYKVNWKKIKIIVYL